MQPLQIQIAVVGNSKVGKTRMLLIHQLFDYNSQYLPLCYESEEERALIDKQLIIYQLRDTANLHEFPTLKQLLFNSASVFVVCYAINDQSSLDDITNYWMPELEIYLETRPFILVGLKEDLRHEGSKIVSEKDVQKVIDKFQPYSHILCSACTNLNINLLIDTAIRAAINQKLNNQSQ
ncbi:Rac/Rho-like_protein [Hexamita inflata]|uniref:Rac/Rho-like protein n=1 Tax=Hexamita inflata TaxID=28002 RepID=A0AA86RLS3_9EUKA|nr:Rac/Rho-like protein [Hexamita inflata]